ncbi:MAG TPA: 30S ribosomal protein S9 [Candidatus Paceibacterota bacterium]
MEVHTVEETTKTKKTVRSLGERYLEAVGRRKTATARVRISETKKGKPTFVVNGKDVDAYFPTEEMRSIAREGASKVKLDSLFDVSAVVFGGGIHAQAEAVRHGLSRTLVAYDEELRKKLKKAGFLKRDPRMKERKKFGLKKARKAPQWSKR